MKITILITILAAILLTDSAFSMNLGGRGLGRGAFGRGGRWGWRLDRFGWEWGWGYGGSYVNNQTPPPVPDKFEMPPEVQMSAFDETAFDNPGLNLNGYQQKRVDDRKAEIQERIKNLEKLQWEARNRYAKAVTPAAILQTAQEVIQTANACRNYDPNGEFRSTLITMLTTEQRIKFNSRNSAALKESGALLDLPAERPAKP